MRKCIISTFITLLAFVSTTKAQGFYLNVGYQIGNLGKGANSLKNEVFYMNNVKYSDLSNPISYPGFVHGIDVELMAGKLEPKSIYFFWNWSNSHVVARGTAIDPALSNEMDIAIKYRINNLTLTTFGFKISDWLGIAYSPIDIGKLKVLYKNSGEEDAHSYIDFYNVEKGILSDYTIYGSTYYLDFFLKKRLRIHLSYYKSWGGIDLRDKEDIETVHYYNADRFHVSLAYMLRLNK
jgi:hypothetical protein